MTTRKWVLTACFLIGIIAIGVTYQYAYQVRKTAYRETIAGYYREYFGREPKETELRYWANLAVNRWGIEKVKRVAFIEGKAKRDS